MKTEYPTKCRFDIAIIDEGRIQGFEEYKNNHLDINLNNEVFWCQIVKIGIEIKYCQLGDRINDKFKSMTEDLRKLKKYSEENNDGNFTGLALLFVQSASINFTENIRKVALADSTDKLAEGIQGWIITPQKKYSFNYSILDFAEKVA